MCVYMFKSMIDYALRGSVNRDNQFVQKYRLLIFHLDFFYATIDSGPFKKFRNSAHKLVHTSMAISDNISA